ncbi:MAG: FeoB-associated Cys-rich membrane protein [Blautia sp.]|nr:FeoB-associated Cys-rich membrane protein [Blautia sp.]
MKAIIGNGITILLIAGLLALAIRELWKSHKSGGCSCGCGGCPGSCSACGRYSSTGSESGADSVDSGLAGDAKSH